MVTDVCRSHLKNRSFGSEESSSEEQRDASALSGTKGLLHATRSQKCAAALVLQFFCCVSACLPLADEATVSGLEEGEGARAG